MGLQGDTERGEGGGGGESLTCFHFFLFIDSVGVLGSQEKVFLSLTVHNPHGESEDMWERSPLCSVQSKGLIWFGEVK